MSVTMYQNTVTRVTKERADLQKKLSQEQQKIAKLKGEIITIQRSITNSTSASTLHMKLGQIASKEKDLAQAHKNFADLEGKMAQKTDDLNRNLQSLERAQAEAQRKQDAEAKKRRDEELRHAKDVTRETERQARLHQELGRSRYVIDLAKLPTKIKVVFFAANTLDLTPLRLDAEVRSITEKLRASEYRDAVEFVSRWAVQPGDLLQALNEHTPHIVHFSGHGSEDEIVFTGSSGSAKPVSTDAIVQLMNVSAEHVRVVVFNACSTSAQAQAAVQYVDVAIGMNTEIGDEAARVFAAQFYSAIGFGRSIQQAFDQARLALMLEGIPEENTPVLFVREGINASDVILVRPEDM